MCKGPGVGKCLQAWEILLALDGWGTKGERSLTDAQISGSYHFVAGNAISRASKHSLWSRFRERAREFKFGTLTLRANFPVEEPPPGFHSHPGLWAQVCVCWGFVGDGGGGGCWLLFWLGSRQLAALQTFSLAFPSLYPPSRPPNEMVSF